MSKRPVSTMKSSSTVDPDHVTQGGGKHRAPTHHVTQGGGLTLPAFTQLLTFEVSSPLSLAANAPKLVEIQLDLVIAVSEAVIRACKELQTIAATVETVET